MPRGRPRKLRLGGSHLAAPLLTPWPLQRDCPTFYGNPRQAGWLHANTVEVTCPWPLIIDGTHVNHILIHKKCADSLTRVLNAIWDGVGHSLDRIKTLHYDQYSGSYNLRSMRGGQALSMHSYACAIDFYDKGNEFHSQQHEFKGDSLIVKAFEAEAWVWGGWWGHDYVDAMHFQAARVHP